jgi:hypothetical protein
VPHASFHAVSVKAGQDPAGALNAALATATRQLHEQVREAETNLDSFRLSGISHAHTVTSTADGATHAVVTAVASYEYT